MRWLVLAAVMLAGCGGSEEEQACAARCDDALAALVEACPRCMPVHDPVVCADGACECSGSESCGR